MILMGTPNREPQECDRNKIDRNWALVYISYHIPAIFLGFPGRGHQAPGRAFCGQVFSLGACKQYLRVKPQKHSNLQATCKYCKHERNCLEIA